VVPHDEPGSAEIVFERAPTNAVVVVKHVVISELDDHFKLYPVKVPAKVAAGAVQVIAKLRTPPVAATGRGAAGRAAYGLTGETTSLSEVKELSSLSRVVTVTS
jgi:hypothetical protein